MVADFQPQLRRAAGVQGPVDGVVAADLHRNALPCRRIDPEQGRQKRMVDALLLDVRAEVGICAIRQGKAQDIGPLGVAWPRRALVALDKPGWSLGSCSTRSPSVCPGDRRRHCARSGRRAAASRASKARSGPARGCLPVAAKAQPFDVTKRLSRGQPWPVESWRWTRCACRGAGQPSSATCLAVGRDRRVDHSRDPPEISDRRRLRARRRASSTAHAASAANPLRIERPAPNAQGHFRGRGGGTATSKRKQRNGPGIVLPGPCPALGR